MLTRFLFASLLLTLSKSASIPPLLKCLTRSAQEIVQPHARLGPNVCSCVPFSDVFSFSLSLQAYSPFSTNAFNDWPDQAPPIDPLPP